MHEGEDPRFLKVVTTAKHFAAYDCENCYPFDDVKRGGFNANVTDQDMVEYYLPAWRVAIETAKVESIMCAYNAINGIPACGNSLTMTTIAREEWNFEGFFVSDCSAIDDVAFTNWAKENVNGRPDRQAAQAILS
eukprot:UN28258